MENNVLIAEFMGLEEQINAYHLKDIEDPVFYQGRFDGFNSHFRGNELKYHEKWEWLMPVVERIVLLGGTISMGPTEGKVINDVYGVVVLFIKRHNEKEEKIGKN